MKSLLINLLKENNFYERNDKAGEFISSKCSSLRAIVSETAIFIGTYNPKANKKYDMDKYEDLKQIESILKNYKR